MESKRRLIFNLFVVWFLTGVWHGAAWSFIAWGLMYFVLVTSEKLTGFPGNLSQPWLRQIYRVGTLLAVVLGWVIFRASGFINGLRYIACMFGLMGNPLTSGASMFLLRQSALLLATAIVFVVPVVPWLNRKLDEHLSGMLALTARELVTWMVYMVAFVSAVSFTVTNTYDPFIYFNF